MFKKETSSTYFYAVPLTQISEEGKEVKGDFMAKFPRLKEDEIKELITPASGKPYTDEEVIAKIFLGGRDAKNGDGTDTDLSTPEARVAFLNDNPGSRKRVVRRWLKSVGRLDEDGQEKN